MDVTWMSPLQLFYSFPANRSANRIFDGMRAIPGPAKMTDIRGIPTRIAKARYVAG